MKPENQVHFTLTFRPISLNGSTPIASVQQFPGRMIAARSSTSTRYGRLPTRGWPRPGHPRIEQALMRHFDIELTTKVYTDPALSDLVTAVESLPMVHRMLHRTGFIGVQSQSTDVNEGGDSGEIKVAS
jgi:hypothetical protein